MKTTDLVKARNNKNDNFYTSYNDVEIELSHYNTLFRDKIIYCNCDTKQSSFWVYFHRNFSKLGLKRLMCTSIESKFCYVYNGGDDKNIDSAIVKQLKDFGDFSSEDCKKLLEESDIIVTNPPFSLFRSLIDLLELKEKKYIIWGTLQACTYKNVFNLLMNDKLQLGFIRNKVSVFRLDDNSKIWDVKLSNRINNGNKYTKVNGITVYTNIKIDNGIRQLDLDKTKFYNPFKYDKYDNYDAIEIKHVVDIPCDFDGVMGVPISFLTKYNVEQFEIVGLTRGFVGDFKEWYKIQEAYPILEYVNSYQYKEDGTKIKNNLANTRATIRVRNVDGYKNYYRADNVGYSVVVLFPRLLIRKRRMKNGTD